MYSGVVSVVLWVQFGAAGVVDVVWCSVVYLVQFGAVGVVWCSWCRMWSSNSKVQLKSLKKIWKKSGFTENQTMTWPIAPSIEYNQANWKEIRPILSSLNIYPIDGGSEMTWNIWSEIHHIFQVMLLVLNYGAGKAMSLAFEN